MLLSDAKKLFIDGSRVSSIYYEGKKVYPLSVENWLTTHTWAEIKAACDDGTIADYVALGDTVDIDCGTYGVNTFRVIGINQQLSSPDAAHGLVFQATKGISNIKWRDSGTCIYTSSLVHAELQNIKAQMPADLTEVMGSATIFYSSSTSKTSSSTTSSSQSIFILSQYEMGYSGSGDFVPLSNVYSAFLQGWYVDNKPDFESGIWTRDRAASNAYLFGLYSNNWGFGTTAYGDTNVAGVAACFVI